MTINSATMIIPGAERFFYPMYSVRYLEKKRFPDGTTINQKRSGWHIHSPTLYLEISEVLEEDVQASTTGSYPERE